MNRAPILFGIFTLLVGLGTGFLIYSFPEGLNPEWPFWMAMFVPGLFMLGGLHMIAVGLDYPRISIIILRALPVCFLAIANWAAFFTNHFHCVETISFFGFAIFSWHPNEMECRNSLRVLMACVDTTVILLYIASSWHKWQNIRNKPTK
jgi:hypothetical protein